MFDYYVSVIACVWYPHFTLAVLAHGRCDLARPAAVHTTLEAHACIVDCSAAARAQGVTPGMLLARALGACPELELIDLDDARVHLASERFLERLEQLGADVEPLQAGRALLPVRPLRRMYGGVEGVAARIQQAFPLATETLRVGLGPNRFIAEVAAWRARAGQPLIVDREQARELLGPLPTRVLPIEPRMLETWIALGLNTLADVAALERAKVAERFGRTGEHLHRLAHGIDHRRIIPRTHQEPLEESMTFPEAMGSLVTLERAVRVLVDRALSRPLFTTHAPRSVTVSAELVSGGTWRSYRVLRQPSTDAAKVALTAVTELDQIPAPVERILVRFDQYVPHAMDQRAFDSGEHERRDRLQEGVRHVQAALDEEALLSVLEVAPESRVPERRAVLVPADMGDVA